MLLYNLAAARILGYVSDKVLVGKDWFKVFLSESDYEEVHGYFKDLVRGDLDPHEQYTNDVLSDDGTIKTIEWQNTLLKDDDGNIVGVVSSGKDITKEREMELTLQEQRKLLRNVIDENPDPIAVKDKDVKFILVNKALAELYGSTPEAMMGKDDGDYIPDREQAEFFRRNVRDITKRVEEEEEFKLLKFALDQMSEANFLIDETGRMQRVNEAACRSLGYSREELEQMRVTDIDPDFSDHCALQIL